MRRGDRGLIQVGRIIILMNLQGARVLLGERGQEDIGKVDEEGTDGLF